MKKLLLIIVGSISIINAMSQKEQRRLFFPSKLQSQALEVVVKKNIKYDATRVPLELHEKCELLKKLVLKNNLQDTDLQNYWYEDIVLLEAFLNYEVMPNSQRFFSPIFEQNKIKKYNAEIILENMQTKIENDIKNEQIGEENNFVIKNYLENFINKKNVEIIECEKLIARTNPSIYPFGPTCMRGLCYDNCRHTRNSYNYKNKKIDFRDFPHS